MRCQGWATALFLFIENRAGGHEQEREQEREKREENAHNTKPINRWILNEGWPAGGKTKREKRKVESTLSLPLDIHSTVIRRLRVVLFLPGRDRGSSICSSWPWRPLKPRSRLLNSPAVSGTNNHFSSRMDNKTPPHSVQVGDITPIHCSIRSCSTFHSRTRNSESYQVLVSPQTRPLCPHVRV